MLNVRRARTALPTLILLVLLALLITFPAAAQAPALSIQEASLRLWPEYDDPGLLVIFAGTFSDSATFPQKVAFPIPANARNIQATYQDASGSLITQAWEIVDGKLTYTLPVPQFHIEYYVDRPPSGSERIIAYTFEAPYAVGALMVTVQQPARATGFGLTPPSEQALLGEDGLTYHTFKRANLAAGEKLDLQLRYTKTDSGLSAPQLAIPSATAMAPATTETNSAPNTWLPWALIGLGGAALAGAVGYWLWMQRNAQGAASLPPTGTAVRPAAPSTRGGPAAYCTQCGHALQPEDRFCAQCGTRRRK